MGLDLLRVSFLRVRLVRMGPDTVVRLRATVLLGMIANTILTRPGTEAGVMCVILTHRDFDSY